MNKTAYLLLLLAFSSLQLTAQNPGCDGSRYKNDVFTTVKKTTVDYAPTTAHLGNQIVLQMDVYEPEGDVVAERPVVILAHGGSFIFGDRTMMDRWCNILAKKGYVAATITYRLYPFFSLGFPDSLDIFDTAVKAVGDMRAAVRYFREDAANANVFKVDADHIYIGGYSAGAVTALHCAYLDGADDAPSFLQNIINNNGGLEGISGTVTNKTYSSSIGAVVNMSGGLYRSGWIDQVEKPLVSIHGTADETVPFVSGLAAGIAFLEGSSRLHTQATDINLWNSLHIVPNGGHTNIYESAVYQPHLDTFWVNASTMLEALTCSTVDATEPSWLISDWTLSPNPAIAGKVQLSWQETANPVMVNVYDVSGKVVMSQNLSNGRTELDVQALVPGVYFVEPIGAEKRFLAKTLIIE
jgi:para-nitrobenzyl esterase